MAKTIKIGTRKSMLALWQTRHVIATLKDAHPGVDFEEVLFTTQGDIILDKPLAQIGDKGLFTFELEERLRDGSIDMAVHSLKDLPTALPEGLVVGAVLERAIPFDALVSANGAKFCDLPQGAVVGTSSLRRAAQLSSKRPDITLKDIRGNVDTRLKKLDDGQYDAIILAAAGLTRLGLADRITEVLDDGWYYAVGQGAMAVESAAANDAIAPYLKTLEDSATRQRVTAERAFLNALEGGCQVPIGVRSTVTDGTLSLDGMISNLAGTTILSSTVGGAADAADTLGHELAADLIAQGGADVLKEIR